MIGPKCQVGPKYKSWQSILFRQKSQNNFESKFDLAVKTHTLSKGSHQKIKSAYFGYLSKKRRGGGAHQKSQIIKLLDLGI